MSPYLSVIIPTFNEEARIGRTLEACVAYLSKQDYTYEILVVDDGSVDSTTEVVTKYVALGQNIMLKKHDTNKGKGAAVQTGMLISNGEYRLCMDADNATSIEQVAQLLPYLKLGHDIVIGSRRIDGSVIKSNQGPLRTILGSVFHIMVPLIVPLNVRDTQNGFKLFSEKAAKEIFPKLHTSGWCFDVEVLLRARHMGYAIKEVPIIWNNDKRSKMRLKQMPRMLIDLFLIRAIKA